MRTRTSIHRYLIWLLILSFVFRAVLAAFTELGNDEVYYRLYAVYPDLSHFDHPPMVGLVIQLFSLDLLFQSEFFIRLGAVVLGTLNTFIIYLIGREIRDELTGFYAALLFTASVYCSVIAGTFILPDAPQIFFWLLTLFLLIRTLPDKETHPESRKRLLLAGITAGLALLSKYHSVFLMGGAGLYMIFYNRRWFKTKELYLSLLIAILIILPVIIWNFRNDFVSFTFHEERVDNYSGIRWDYLGTELLGQFFYNNPVNVVLIILSLIALFRNNDFMKKDAARILLFISVPLSLVFLAFSLYNPTLPHWTGPAYIGYILIAASWLSGRKEKHEVTNLFPVALKVAVFLPALLLVVALLQINSGFIPLNPKTDPTSQLYGYRQLGEKFAPLAAKAEEEGDVKKGSPIMTTRWFPAANFDYYVAMPSGKEVFAVGSLERIHKYFWINKVRNYPKAGSDAWYIGLSDGMNDPYTTFGTMYDSIRCSDTIDITRGGRLLREAYVYRLYGLKGN